jgi:hypothetical protein
MRALASRTMRLSAVKPKATSRLNGSSTVSSALRGKEP